MFGVHDRIFQTEDYFCVAAAWLVRISTQQYSSRRIHLQYCNHQNTHAFFVRKATWIKKLIFGMIRQAGTWYTQISSKKRLHAVATLSFDSSTHCPRRFWLAVFLEKQSDYKNWYLGWWSEYSYRSRPYLLRFHPRIVADILQAWEIDDYSRNRCSVIINTLPNLFVNLKFA